MPPDAIVPCLVGRAGVIHSTPCTCAQSYPHLWKDRVMADDEALLSGQVDLMSAGGPEGDPVAALQAATLLMSEDFGKRAGCTEAGLVAAAQQVTVVADVFVRWLRRPVTIKFGPATVTEQPIFPATAGAVVSTAGGTMATIDTSQIVTWDVDPEDDRGFDVDVVLDVVNSNDAAATVVFVPATAGVLAQVVATAVAPGSTLITVSVPGSDPLVSGSLAVDVIPGGVATLEFGEAVITEQAPPAPPVI